MNCFFNALFMFINNPEVRDLNYRIALGLLENGHELDYLTINELAERCFVSTSSLNRFFRIYGYNKYMIFKALFSSHLRIRYVQIQNRMTDKDYEMLHKVFSSFLKQEDYERLIDMTWVKEVCEMIHKSKRVILIGSDEMASYFTRMQTDFYIMGKLIMKDSVYKTNFFTPEKDDCVILLSMEGRIVDLNTWLLSKLKENNSQIITIGHYDYLQDAYGLTIPQGLDEVLENMILDYYIQKITYYYAEKYL